MIGKVDVYVIIFDPSVTVNKSFPVNPVILHVIFIELTNTGLVTLYPVTVTVFPVNPVPFIVKAVPLLVMLVIVGRVDVNAIIFDPSVTVNVWFPIKFEMLHVIVVELTRTWFVTVYPVTDTDTVGPTKPVPVIVKVGSFTVIPVMVGKVDV